MKIFHTHADEPDHIIITNLRNGKTVGPITLANKEGILEEAKFTLDNFAEANYPND